MGFKELFILIEGDDDQRFFERILKPGFEKKYDSVNFYRYAVQPPKKIENFIKSIRAMKADYIVAADINHSPCVTQKKEALLSKKFKHINIDNIIIVIKEIESWYLAGLNESSRRELGIKSHKANIDELTKEQFDSLIPDKFNSRIVFMQEILKYFEIKTAAGNNKSFAYFTGKYEGFASGGPTCVGRR